MDRHLMAYLLIAACLLVVAGVLARARYYARHRVLRRRRLAHEALGADRARHREDDIPPAD